MYLPKKHQLFSILSLLLFLFGCEGENRLNASQEFKSISDLDEADFTAISANNYYFGHQSVGLDIIDGLKMIMNEYPALKLDIVSGEDSSLAKPGTLLHSKVGKNRDPLSKITAFQEIIENELGDNVDTAFLKFCYVDADKNSNASNIFSKYKTTIETLKEKYPNTTFIHFTMPLKTVPQGIKVSIKNLIGKEVPQQLDNIVRGEYNDLLRNEYIGYEPVFDIAYYESIAPDSKESYKFKLNDKNYQTMAPMNTSDGGHLSDNGKRWIAEQLVVFLANLPSKS